MRVGTSGLHGSALAHRSRKGTFSREGHDGGHDPHAGTFQFAVELKAVITTIGKHGDVKQASYEIEQGRELVEKAVSIGLPEPSFADLQRHSESFDGRTGG